MKQICIKQFTVLALVMSLVACGNDSNAKIQGSERSNEIDEVRSAITGIMLADQAPGMSVALIADNKVVFSEGFGVSNLESGIPATADTSFWLGSTSKSVTGVALMRAQEQGILSLGDSVQSLLANDTLVGLTLPHSTPILLEHLVTHTSGIVDGNTYDCAYFVGDEFGEHFSLANALVGGDCDETAPADLGGFLNAHLSETGVYYSAADNFLDAEPGTTFEYSNIGTALAGYTIEALTGTSLADYAQTHIFEPLGMGNTSWKLSALNSANIATPHFWNGAEMMVLPLYSLSTWPDGGLRSSANDLAKYLMTVANDGELPAITQDDGSVEQAVRILESDSVSTLLEPQVDDGTGLSFGVFWITLVLPNGRVLVGHEGADPGAYSYMFFDPEISVGVVMLGNGDDNITEDFSERHYMLIEKLMDHAKTLGTL